jgi:Protein of unknown function (DUF2788)
MTPNEIEALIEAGTPFMIGGLILFMFFIVYGIAKESKAGKEGTIWLLSVLCMGVVGYIAKIILEFVFKQKL